uniref:GRIP domain-containing protein n=1 Tax=Strongyloides venezuelensis TaxID=75913 RepID=A0A0K0F4Z1_STRVS
MVDQELKDQNEELKKFLEERNDEVAQLKHKYSLLKIKADNDYQWGTELENVLKSLKEETVSKEMYNDVLQKVEWLKKENSDLVSRIAHLEDVNERLNKKIEMDSQVNKNEEDDEYKYKDFNDSSYINESQCIIESLENKVKEMEQLNDEIGREKDELQEVTAELKNMIREHEIRIAELEDENLTLQRDISEAKECVSKAESEKTKSVEKCIIEDRGCNLFTEIIENGKKVETDLKEAYDKLQDEKKRSHKKTLEISKLKNEINRMQEENTRFCSMIKIKYTSERGCEVSALKKQIEDLEELLVEQKQTINRLISNDEANSNYQYRLENNSLRNKMLRNIEQYNSTIRSVSGELDKSKRLNEMLKSAIVELRSVNCKGNAYKGTRAEKMLNEIETNFDILLMDPSKENLEVTKRKLGDTNDTKSKVRNLRIDCNTKEKKYLC